jgi:threonine/homoserine/homoserine lactone efflux protein
MADSGHRRRPTVRGLPYQTDTPSLAYRAPMLEALVAGALAGYAIAVPMGPITILILQTGLRHGLRIALAAAAGAASADGLYATLAGLFGAALISVIQPVIVPARVLGAVLLAIIGLRGLLGALRRPTARTDPQPEEANDQVRTYLLFLGLTVTNPMTFLYFFALTLSLPVLGGAVTTRLVFAAAAFAASLSWQVVLASIGSLLHGRLPDGAALATRVIGSAVVLGFAILIGYQALGG